MVFTAGDILVIGAGAAGLLTFRELVAAGYSCTLIDSVGVGGGQSNHSHGYMHSGYIYVNGSSDLVRPLVAGSRYWQTLLARLDVIGANPNSTVSLASSVEAKAARSAWRAAGLAVSPAKAPDGIYPSAFAASFDTPEPSFDFTPVWKQLAASPGGRQVHATLKKLQVGDGRVVGADVMLEGRRHPVTLRAAVYVLAAGWNNPAIMRVAVSYRGRAISRMSHMLVVSGSRLPALSLIVPSHEFQGLFAVSRPLPGGGHAWLVSNYLSMAFDTDHQVSQRLWLNATLRTLSKIAPALDDPHLRWGVYRAPKGELRDVPGEMRSYSCESYGLSNLLALAPTKLTLAPLLAQEASQRIADLAGCVGARVPEGAELDAPTESLQVLPERWTQERLVPLGQFAASNGCVRAASLISADARAS